MTTADKLAKLRKDNNYTQEQLAEILGVTRQSISKWESGVAFPETEKIITLCKLYDCSMDYLFKDDVDEKGNKLVSETGDKLAKVYCVYLTFVPLFGFILGLYFSLKKVYSKKQQIIAIVGMIFSLTLITVMIVGLSLGL